MVRCPKWPARSPGPAGPVRASSGSRRDGQSRNTALRRLHPQILRRRAGAGFQLAACAARSLRGLHPQPAGEGWRLIETAYDDGGLSGGTLQRAALQRLLADIAQHRVDTVVVYKVDRLTRSLMDFAKLVELFDRHGVTFVAVTQQFNTTSSMGRLTLNILLSFAQFEREVIGERVRDKIAASKRK